MNFEANMEKKGTLLVEREKGEKNEDKKRERRKRQISEINRDKLRESDEFRGEHGERSKEEDLCLLKEKRDKEEREGKKERDTHTHTKDGEYGGKEGEFSRVSAGKNRSLMGIPSSTRICMANG